MDQIKVKSMKAADIAKDFTKADIPSSTCQDNELLVLKDWEMVLAGGGDAVVCW